MKKLIFAASLTFVSMFAAAQHRTITDSLTHSAIYPGTVHYVTVTVPESLQAADTAALYVGLDGILCNAPQRLDSLAAEGVIRPTVGVFLQSGLVKDKDGTVVRYNRSNEFDSTDPRFATFLDTELLPFAERLSGVTFTKDPEQRAIFGLSSGGIAAFTAAWHRPDLFGRVFTGCATLVPMRGGHNLQAIVRKHEPKPLRIFVQDGRRDTWNPIFGSWYEANYLMASALDFAGYDHDTFWDDTAHSVATSSAIFPQVMKWLMTSDSKARPTQNNFLAPRLIEGETWREAPQQTIEVEDYAIYPDSSLRADRADYATNRLIQTLRLPDGSWGFAEPLYWLHTYDNSQLALGGMAFDADGYLWTVTSAGLQACDQNGRVRGILSLPAGIDIAKTGIAISNGSITLSDGTHTYTRRLNVSAPTPGTRPASQGQA